MYVLLEVDVLFSLCLLKDDVGRITYWGKERFFLYKHKYINQPPNLKEKYEN